MIKISEKCFKHCKSLFVPLFRILETQVEYNNIKQKNTLNIFLLS